jgi:hypothetical protein
MKKQCKTEGCSKGAIKPTEFCIRHGGGLRCKYEECSKGAIKLTGFCARHGGGKRCSKENCNKLGIGKNGFCISHGGGKRCIKDGCDKVAIGKTELCVSHGGGKRCIKDGCDKVSQNKSEFCISHGGGKRCIKDGCDKVAIGKTEFCVSHGGGKRCIKDGCKKVAQGSTNFCIVHGGGYRCPNCKDWPDSRCGIKKYDGYCITCFKHLFPTDSRSITIRSKSHEMKVRNYLNLYKSGFIHDIPLYTGHCDCTHRRRIDHRTLIENTMLVVETDERQHRYYNKKDEEDRYDDLYMIFPGKWIFIRFNPDSFTKKGVIYNIDIKQRLTLLLEEINKHEKRIYNSENTELIEIYRLFYDE